MLGLSPGRCRLPYLWLYPGNVSTLNQGLAYRSSATFASCLDTCFVPETIQALPLRCWQWPDEKRIYTMRPRVQVRYEKLLVEPLQCYSASDQWPGSALNGCSAISL